MIKNHTIRVAIAGVGNCAASLCEIIAKCNADPSTNGVMTHDIGGYGPGNIEVACAFDVDSRKVGHRLSEAIRAEPNCAIDLGGLTGVKWNPTVDRGPTLDGIAPHRRSGNSKFSIPESEMEPVDITERLKQEKVDVLICYLPVGSEKAVRHYAEAALQARVAFVNCVPVFVSADRELAEEYQKLGIPLIGDDVRSQIGATIIHQRLVELITERGGDVFTSMQLNVGGNADFYNMTDQERLESKRISKTRAVKAHCSHGDPLLHVGPSDFVEHLCDRKVAYIEIEAGGVGGVPIRLDVKLTVEDSPNSAGVVLDVVRYAAQLKSMRKGGVHNAVSSYYMKSPPTRISDREASQILKELAQCYKT